MLRHQRRRKLSPGWQGGWRGGGVEACYICRAEGGGSGAELGVCVLHLLTVIYNLHVGWQCLETPKPGEFATLGFLLLSML